MSHPLKVAFYELNSANSKLFSESERKKRGRPRNTSKELQKILQKIHKILKDEYSRPHYFYNTNPDVFQQAINSIETVLNKYKDVNVITKATDCLIFIVMIILKLGLSGKDNDWEQIVVDSLSLIESADVINSLLTGCKENKKLLSQENFFEFSNLASSMISASDYELQLRHLEILFRLCPRVQDDREIFASRAFVHKDMNQKFLAITANDFLRDSRYFLNSLNDSNDGIIKMPKTFVVSQIKYNKIELYCPEGQGHFFIDFNKWTISTTIRPIEINDSVENDVLEIKYSKISSWDLQTDQTLIFYLPEPLKLSVQDAFNLQNNSISNGENTIFIKFDYDVRNSLEMILADRHLEKKTHSVGGLQSRSSLNNNTATTCATLSKSSELSIAEKIDKSVNTELAKNSQNYIATYNTELSPENYKSQHFETRIITSSTTRSPSNPSNFSSQNNSPTMNHQSIMQIFDIDNVKRLNVFQPPKKCSEPLQLSVSKKQRSNKIYSVNEEIGEDTIMAEEAEHQIPQAELSKTNTLHFFTNSDEQEVSDDIIIIEQNNNSTQNINAKTYIYNANKKNVVGQTTRLHKGPNLTIDENIRDIDHRKRKITVQDSSEDELENPKFSNINKMNKLHKRQLKINKDDSPIKSEEEFWNPTSAEYNAEDEVFERMRAQFPIEFFRELGEKNLSIPKPNHEKKRVSFVERLKEFSNSDDESIKKRTDRYILHTRNISPINSSEITIQPSLEDVDIIDDSDVTPIDTECKIDRSNKYAKEKLDEEIRRLLQCIGETIFKQFHKQDVALFRVTRKTIVQNEISLTQGLETQSKNKRELLNTFKRNYATIAIAYQQMIKELKEERKKFASLKQVENECNH
ncbi:14958_t:CDS:10 [Funneliformis geosporum]|uniref:12314_t:CDS:1 n=1 Tax=Funneliformis geosporum TaxID=1117311 RepID=A0A9W4SVM7_9GLOM|nr:14958_t:CDS:10 [Funneliformis geosporum]CAI2182512.1 12314_t:CDS:10 [Funneliformis geosporum]